MTNFLKYFRGDKYIWLILTALTIVSLLAIYSATSYLAYRSQMNSPEYFLFKQFLFLLVGFTIVFIVHQINYLVFAKVSNILIFISVILLILTQFIGTEINDARRALTIPLINLSFQTADFARISVLIFLTSKLALNQEEVKSRSTFLKLFIPIAIVCLLISLSSLSSSMLLFITCLVMLFVGRVAWKHLFAIFGGGVALFALLIFVLSLMPDTGRYHTWKNRIENYLSNEKDESYQMRHAKMAIAGGQLYGRGPGKSLERNILPNAYDDFIYAIIIEEYGILGGALIMFLYLSLLYRATRIVIKSPKAIGALLAIGIGFNITIQAIVNMGVNTGFFPLTGQPLPIISRGGTSMLFTAISFGILLSISRMVESQSNNQTISQA